jgi:hypothetical protein
MGITLFSCVSNHGTKQKIDAIEIAKSASTDPIATTDFASLKSTSMDTVITMIPNYSNDESTVTTTSHGQSWNSTG